MRGSAVCAVARIKPVESLRLLESNGLEVDGFEFNGCLSNDSDGELGRESMSLTLSSAD